MRAIAAAGTSAAASTASVLRCATPPLQHRMRAAPGGGASSGRPRPSSPFLSSNGLRRTLSVSAMFGFQWPWAKPAGASEAGGSGGGDDGGKFGSILKAARTAKRGCPLAPKEAPPGLKLATFAGGCFWGLELAYQRVPGVVKTSVGYAGGQDPAPTYDSVCMGVTGHTESIQVTFDPKEVAYETLLDVFFDRVDPTTLNRQVCV
jgi:hypothetical protein